MATREMESRGCRRGNREELGIGEGGGGCHGDGGRRLSRRRRSPATCILPSNGSGVLRVGGGCKTHLLRLDVRDDSGHSRHS